VIIIKRYGVEAVRDRLVLHERTVFVAFSLEQTTVSSVRYSLEIMAGSVIARSSSHHQVVRRSIPSPALPHILQIMQIIVLGMHRSGTSVVGQLLEAMGFYFAPKSLAMPPQADNPKGFWERLDVVNLNDKALAAGRSRWDAPGAWLPDRVSAKFLEEFDLQASSIIQDFEVRQPWFVKDPRMCITLPLWKKHFSNAVYVIVHRHPLADRERTGAAGLGGRQTRPDRRRGVFGF